MVQSGNIGLYILVLWRCVLRVLLPLSVVFVVITATHATALKALYLYDHATPSEFKSELWSFGKLFSVSATGAAAHAPPRCAPRRTAAPSAPVATQ